MTHEPLSREAVLAHPISSIIDGWDLKDGGLYLFVRTETHIQTIVIPKGGE